MLSCFEVGQIDGIFLCSDLKVVEKLSELLHSYKSVPKIIVLPKKHGIIPTFKNHSMKQGLKNSNNIVECSKI